MMNPVFLPILVPLGAALVILVLSAKLRWAKEAVVLLATAANLYAAARLFGKNIVASLPWAGFGIDLAWRLDHFSSFIILATAVFGFLLAVYCISFMRGKDKQKQFYLYFLLSLVCVNGAVLADNLVCMLFFWEGLLGVMFGMIAIGNKNAFKTATKMFIIVGVCDICMMAGIAIASRLAGTLTISSIHLPLTNLGALAFILLMIGAISKGGSMPFHTWIPDAAIDAPVPFMALLPASLEKLLGIYFLTRITMEMFALAEGAWVCTVMMVIGAVTIVCAVMMALIQKNYKRLLAYHAVSQVGYMILGVGTGVPAGIIGGLFHMVNNALYKSCLFLTAGSVERQAGTADLEKLGGLRVAMPVTFACFAIAAASISGMPPFNGFFSKELIYEAALEKGRIFYIMALVGSFFTAASFLKLGHAAYFGRKNTANANVKEAPAAMLMPMIVIAGLCILFGVWNALPIEKLIQPVLGEARLEGHSFAGFPKNIMLTLGTIAVLIAAFIHHVIAAKKMGGGVKASEHIHHAPGLSFVYDKAERRWFDPYDIGMKIMSGVAALLWAFDRVVDWVQSGFIVWIARTCSRVLSWLQSGNYAAYIIWSLIGGAIALAVMMK